MENENELINQVPQATSITGALLLGTDKDGKTKNFPVTTFMNNYKGTAVAATLPGAVVAGNEYEAVPGLTYPNFLNAANQPITIPAEVAGKQVLTAKLRAIDATHWEAVFNPVEVGASFSRKTDFLPDYLSDKTINFSSTELLILKALKEFNFSVADNSLVDDSWIVKAITKRPSSGDFALNHYLIWVFNETTSAGAFLTTNIGFEGVNVFGSKVGTAGIVDYSAVVDFGVLPEEFVYFADNSPNRIKIFPNSSAPISGAFRQLKSELKTDKKFIKANPDYAYNLSDNQIYDAIVALDLIVPAGQEGHNWNVYNVRANVTNLRYLFTVRNTTTGVQYFLANNEDVALTISNGYHYYAGVVNGLKFNLTLDWKKIPADLNYSNEYYPGVQIVPGVFNQITDLVTQASIRFDRSPWVGKKIMYLGTSIIDDSTIAERIATQHGATLIKKALNSSAVRSGYFDGTPEGAINGVSFGAYVRSLSQSSSKKEDIIANYAANYKPYLAGAPDVLTDTLKSLIRESSYEVRLLPWLNGTNPMPDLFVIEHAYNDREGYAAVESHNDFLATPLSRGDKTTYIGAMTWLIDLIFQYNRDAKIVIHGIYENQLRPAMALGQQKIADYFQLPICKTWEKTRFSQNKIPGTSDLWNVAPWLNYKPSAGSEANQNMTHLRYYLADGTHPNASFGYNTKANDLIGDIVAEFLNGTY